MTLFADRLLWIPERLHRASRARYWRRVARWRARLRESDRWSAEQIAAHQWEQAIAVLRHAYDNVPYYRELLGGIGAEPGDIRSWDDWRRIPLLEKHHLQERGDDLLARGVPEERRGYATTGGSTGEPVGFWFDRPESVAAETAFIQHAWSRVGYRLGDSTAAVRGLPVEGGGAWQLLPHDRQLRLSSYDLTAETLPAMLARLRAFRPRFIQAYPSSIALLAGYMLDAGEPPIHGVKAVLCGSESLYDWQRARIEAAFGVRAFSWYGQSERVVFAAECESSTTLHVEPRYGLAELVADEGDVIHEPGRVGEIVGTGFTSRAMPLIRYRTADATAYAHGPCPACGRAHTRFERIEGRLQEFIVSATGRPISMTAINMHTPVFDNVRQFRFVQDEPGRIRMRVVPKPTWRHEDDERRIRAELQPKLRDVELSAIELVDEIPATPGGKQRFLDQHLDVRIGDA